MTPDTSREAVERLIAALDGFTYPQAGYALQAASMLAALLARCEAAAAESDPWQGEREAKLWHAKATELAAHLAAAEAENKRLVEAWKNEAQALRFYVGEQQRLATLNACAIELEKTYKP